MRILFLHEVGYFEKPIFEMHEFPEYLVSRGHTVGFVDYLENTSEDVASDNFIQTREGRVVPGVSLDYFSMKSYWPGVLGRLLATLMFPKFFRAVITRFQPDIVVSFSVPTSGWQALLICRKLGIPYVFRALDVSHRIRRTVFTSLVLVAEKFIYRSASWVSCNNPAMRDYCISLGADEKTTSVELPPLDMTKFCKNEGQGVDIRRFLEIPEAETVVLYMGTFFYFSGLDEVIRKLSVLRERPTLLLVGGGEQEAHLRRLVQALNLSNKVIFAGFVEFSQLYSYLSISSVAINPMVPSLVSNTALPNKVLQYMASGLPVVSTKLRGLESLFENVDGIRLVNDPGEVLPAALEIATSPLRAELGRANRQLVAERFSASKSVESIEKLLVRVAKGS